MATSWFLKTFISDNFSVRSYELHWGYNYLVNNKKLINARLAYDLFEIRGCPTEVYKFM